MEREKARLLYGIEGSVAVVDLFQSASTMESQDELSGWIKDNFPDQWRRLEEDTTEQESEDELSILDRDELDDEEDYQKLS